MEAESVGGQGWEKGEDGAHECEVMSPRIILCRRVSNRWWPLVAHNLGIRFPTNCVCGGQSVPFFPDLGNKRSRVQ